MSIGPDARRPAPAFDGAGACVVAYRPMDVLLINPPLVVPPPRNDGRAELDPLQFDQPPIRFPPLGLCYLGAALEADRFTVAVLDASAAGMGPDAVVAEVRRRRPRIVGLSVLVFTLPAVWRIVRDLRATCPDAIVVLGNLHVADDPEVVAKTGAHYGVRGWGEEPLVALARACLRGEGDAASIPGLVFVADGKTVVNPVVAGRPFDDVLPPARHLLGAMRYHTPVDPRPMANVTISRGCAYRCDHCHYGSPGVRACHPHQVRSTDGIVAEFEAIRRDTRARFVVFADDTFTIHRDRILALCEALARQDDPLPWSCETRASLLDEDLLRAMQRAGCRAISIGVETANEAVRARSHKRVTNDQVRAAFDSCRRVGVEAKANFMFGLPGEREEDFEASIRFAMELRPAYVEFHIALTLPNTPLFDDAVARGLLAPDVYDRFMRGEGGFPLYLPEGVTAGAMVRADQAAYRRFYLRPAYVLERLRRLRSAGDLARHVRLGAWVAWSALKR